MSGLLAVNLVICSLDRFPLAWRRFRRKQPPHEEAAFKNLPDEYQFEALAGLEEAAKTAETLLQKRYRSVEREDAGGAVYLAAQKGRFSLFGVYIVHLSLLVLIAGAIVGSVFGIEGYVNIPEGETVSAIQLRGENRSWPLSFSVRCDKFTVELYESGMPKTFQSDLVFLKDGRKALAGKLRVNHPLEFEGFRFYQASYGPAPGGTKRHSLLRSFCRRCRGNRCLTYARRRAARRRWRLCATAAAAT